MAGLLGATGLAGIRGAAAAEIPTLERIKAAGRLVVAVYSDMPPFNAQGQGIDIDLAEALAARLGVKASVLTFVADENMNDDLRNMVWKGHYLGYGPADVLLHVPVDPPLMAENPQVKIFAPYFRERLAIARDTTLVPQMESLASFEDRKIAVAGQSLAGWLLLGADGGAHADQLTTKWKDGADAAQALKRGEVAAAAGNASELESVLHGQDRYAIDPLPLPRMRNGWPVGCAVRKDATELALALQTAMNELQSGGELKQMFDKAGVRWQAAA